MWFVFVACTTVNKSERDLWLRRCNVRRCASEWNQKERKTREEKNDTHSLFHSAASNCFKWLITQIKQSFFIGCAHLKFTCENVLNVKSHLFDSIYRESNTFCEIFLELLPHVDCLLGDDCLFRKSILNLQAKGCFAAKKKKRREKSAETFAESVPKSSCEFSANHFLKRSNQASHLDNVRPLANCSFRVASTKEIRATRLYKTCCSANTLVDRQQHGWRIHGMR